jgi:predicted nucleic acid-binding protein
MSFLYLDSSVMVKRYVEEPGSDWVQSLITDPQNVVILAELITDR